MTTHDELVALAAAAHDVWVALATTTDKMNDLDDRIGALTADAPIPSATVYGPPTDVHVTPGDGTIKLWFGPPAVPSNPLGVRWGRESTDRTGYGPWASDLLPPEALGPQPWAATFDQLVNAQPYEVWVECTYADHAPVRVTLTATPIAPSPPVVVASTGRRIPLVSKRPGGSQHSFNSIQFSGDNTSLASLIRAGQDRGRLFDGVMWFPLRESWAEMKDVNWLGDVPAMLQQGMLVVTTMPWAPESEGSAMNARAAANQYAAEQKDWAQWAVNHGLNQPNHVIDLGWEPNGNWYPWSPQPGEQGASDYRNAYRQTVANFRSGGLFQIPFSVTLNGGDTKNGHMYDLYPGEKFCDSVNTDLYDMWGPVTDHASAVQKYNQAPGYNTTRDFARSVDTGSKPGIMHGKREGANCNPRTTGQYGGDNPVYYTEDFKWWNDPANNRDAAFHVTYNQQGAPSTLHHEWAANPQAYAEYCRTFGGKS